MPGRSRGGTIKTCSPDNRRRIRLLTMIFIFGQRDSRSVKSGAASATCSKLSRRSRIRLSPKNWQRRSDNGSSTLTCTPIVRAIVGATESESTIELRPTKMTPSANSPITSSAKRMESLVFPTPPGPVSVRSRTSSRPISAPAVAISCLRPMNGVSETGSAGGGISATSSAAAASRAVRRNASVVSDS